MVIRKKVKDTIIAVEMDIGDTLEIELRNGKTRRLTLLSAGAEITSTNLVKIKEAEKEGKTNYRFHCEVLIDGLEMRMEREASTQRSFYEPWVIGGMRIWFDAVDKIFDFLTEKHGECRPRKAARFAVQDASLSICPVPLRAWCPLPEGCLDIKDCYNGEDCWLGAFYGADAHGGLDINHPDGTPLWAPVDIDDHYFFNSLEKGDGNNRWRGVHKWPDGSEWILQAHHVTRLTIPEHKPIPTGAQYAVTAGVAVSAPGSHQHTHFVFKVAEEGETILLDPWILFWQMYRDNARGPSL